MPDSKGVVYTKKWVVNLILNIAGYTPDQELYKKTILEPSCGAGTFIVQIIERLMASIGQPPYAEETLKGCIAGYDLDEKAVATTRKAAANKLMEYGLDNTTAQSIAAEWIRQADFLLEDITPCDYVVGNPPYIRATDLPLDMRDLYCKKYQTVTKGCDLYVGFIEKALTLLKNEHSALCYICADRWMQNQYGKKLRAYVANNYHLDTIIKMHDVDAFEEEVSAYPAIIRIDKGKGDIKYVDAKASFSEAEAGQLFKQLRSSELNYECEAYSSSTMQQPKADAIIPLSSPATVKMITELMDKYPSIEEAGIKIGIGIATGKDEVFIVHQPDLVEETRMLPAFNMKDYRTGKGDQPCWLINPWNKDGSLVSLNDYPKLGSYFESHKETLMRRHVASKNQEAWYRTIDKVNWSLIGKPMLLFPDMAMKASPVYSDGTKYPCHNCYWLISEEWDLKALGGLLMSKTAEAFIDALAVKMRGGTMRFQAQYLRLIHIPKWQDVTEDIASMLRQAFETNDLTLANTAARKAYHLED